MTPSRWMRTSSIIARSSRRSGGAGDRRERGLAAEAVPRQGEPGDQPVGKRLVGEPRDAYRPALADGRRCARPGPGRYGGRRSAHHGVVPARRDLDRIVELVPMTRGRAKTAWALLGTTRTASTAGHTIGPPALKAYAVEPVGVEHNTPSQPNAVNRSPSTSIATSRIRSREDFSSDASFRAQVRTIRPGPWTSTSSVMRSSTSYAGRARDGRLGEFVRVGLGEEPDVAEIDAMIGAPAGRAYSAARRNVPSPPSTSTSSGASRP